MANELLPCGHGQFDTRRDCLTCLQFTVDALVVQLSLERQKRSEIESLLGGKENHPPHWIAMTVDVLTGAAQILDSAKLDWGGGWSTWDQSIRDGITTLLKEHYENRH